MTFAPLMNATIDGGPRQRGRRVAAAASLVAIGFLASGCSRTAVAANQEVAAPVTVVTPAVAGAIGGNAYPVTIARDREAALSFRVGGTVIAAPLRIGDRVPAGAIVARLDATPYAAARVRAAEDLARLDRAAARARALVPAGAVAGSVDEDSRSAATAARAALAAARYDEASAVLHAPFAGVVLARQVEVGETVASGQAVLRLADGGSPLIARAAVPHEIATRLRPGMPARVTVAGRPLIPATIRRVGGAADARTGTVEVQLTLTGVALPSGVSGSAVFAGAEPGDQGQSIPAEALLDAQGPTGHVFVVDPRTSKARRVAVSLLGFDGERLRVSGLAADARVITYGAGFVHEGERVEVARQ